MSTYHVLHTVTELSRNTELEKDNLTVIDAVSLDDALDTVKEALELSFLGQHVLVEVTGTEVL